MTHTGRVTAAAGRLLGVALLGVALLVAGCGAGQGAATSQDRPSVPGLNVDTDGIAVRNIAVIFTPGGYEPGDDAPIGLTVFNDTRRYVTLETASSPYAGSVTAAEEPLDIPPLGYVTTVLELTGLTTAVGAADTVPVELGFSNDATLALEVPVAPPPERTGERDPLDLDAQH